MVGSHTPKGKSIGGIGGAIEHTEVAIEHTEFANFEEAYIGQCFYYRQFLWHNLSPRGTNLLLGPITLGYVNWWMFPLYVKT